MLPTPPHFINQAPPGAQQLTRPDFPNVPHFGHVLVFVVAVIGAVIGVLTINSLPGIGWRVTYSVAVALARVGTDMHSVAEIDPCESRNIPVLLAFE